jgi:hypothetical protein
MDPVMQKLFGKMPIEELSVIQSAKIKNKYANMILLISGVAIALGITVYILHIQNIELREKINQIDG